MTTLEQDLFEDVDLENLEIDPNWGTGNFRHTDLGQSRYRMGGANPAPEPNKKPKGFFKRWREYRKKIKEEQPLVRWSEVFGLWKPIFYRGVAKALTSISIPSEKRGNVFVASENFCEKSKLFPVLE